MRWLIRRLLRKGKSSVAYEDDIHFGELLTIGRGADQAIFLPDIRAALQHAQITALGGGQYRIDSKILAGVRVDNNVVQNKIVGPGATLEIGNTRILFLEPPLDFDAGVEISMVDQSERDAREAEAKPPQTLTEAGWRKRAPSWLLFSSALFVCLLVPIFLHFSPKLALKTHHIPLLSQTIWQAGPLAPAHQSFGAQCNLCHEKPFQPVPDSACSNCHKDLAAHADATKFNLPELGVARCAHCHRDHNGKEGLMRSEQSFCSTCHLNLQKNTQNVSKLADVGDFTTLHPEFSVRLPAWNINGEYVPKLTRLDAPGIAELSGLKFPHDVHLREKGLQGPNGTKVLDCGACHTADAGGALIKPIDFESHCQSCHRLDFDLLEPDRQVPHAKVPEIGYMLAEFYAKRALEGGYNDITAPNIIRARRRPGDAGLSPAERQEALAWARDKARNVADTLFESRVCTTCHSVTRQADTVVKFEIAPVRVSGQWFREAQFDHAKHRSSTTCNACHLAKTSTKSSELLIPGIANCRDCHVGEKGKDKLKSTCTMCHGFHIASQIKQTTNATQEANNSE